MRIKVDKSILKATLIQNMEKHVAVYDEVFIEYKAAVIAALDKELTLQKQIPDRPFNWYDFGKGIDRPICHKEEYARAIGMLEISDDSLIELDPSEYEKLVKDNWEWKEQFRNSASNYGKLA